MQNDQRESKSAQIRPGMGRGGGGRGGGGIVHTIHT